MPGALKVSVLGTRMELICCDIWKAQEKNVFVIVDDKIRNIYCVTLSLFMALAELTQQPKSIYLILNDFCSTLFILLLKSQLSEGTKQIDKIR